MLFRSRKGSIIAALKLKRSIAKKAKKDQPDYPDTPGGRNRKKADERLAKREGPESGKSAWERSVGGKLHSGIKSALSTDVAGELRSIGTSNLR